MIESKREYAPVSSGLKNYVASRWQQSKSDPSRARVALRVNVPGVEEHLVAIATAAARPEEERKEALQVLGEVSNNKIIPGLLPLLEVDQPESIRLSCRAQARAL